MRRRSTRHGDEFSGFAQPRRSVDEEHAGWSTIGVATDNEPVVLVPLDGGVGHTELLDSEGPDVAEEVGLATVALGRPEDRFGHVAAAPKRVIPVGDADATPARVRERDAVAACPQTLVADHAQAFVSGEGQRELRRLQTRQVSLLLTARLAQTQKREVVRLFVPIVLVPGRPAEGLPDRRTRSLAAGSVRLPRRRPDDP
jgi:hypothetical protein